MKKIPIGISSCLLGQQVRFDGSHKRDAYIVGTLSEYFEFHPFCPEVAIGLGIPRPTIHLVKIDNATRCVGIKDPTLDVTDRLRDYAEQQKDSHAELCGYILKKDSPSCGMERVKVYAGNQPHRNGFGIYAQEMMRNNPLLPVEETRFHARHKLIIMSHADYREMGQLLAGLTKDNLLQVAERYILQLMNTLKTVVSRSNHVNVLQHIQGYLKKELSADDKAELCDIERYRSGEIPLIVPLTLLKHHFRKSPDPYIEESYYMSPYPQELQLINQL
ncbi:MAG: DUF523 and DUF1722 domain-containing protein [Methylococcaceae bacterium]|nr:DUF523 and DUF1722 domain-containing protein [Methylococcaceae bacterium]